MIQRRKAAAKDAYKLTLRCLSTFDDASSQVCYVALVHRVCHLLPIWLVCLNDNHLPAGVQSCCEVRQRVYQSQFTCSWLCLFPCSPVRLLPQGPAKTLFDVCLATLTVCCDALLSRVRIDQLLGLSLAECEAHLLRHRTTLSCLNAVLEFTFPCKRG